MNREFMMAMLAFFRSPAPTIEALSKLLGANKNPMPPNQFDLLTPRIGGLDRAEVVLIRDNDDRAPIRVANLILAASSTLSLRDVEEVLGRSRPIEEDRPAAPAQLVSFAGISGDGGSEIAFSARVERPAARLSLIRSLQFIRTPPRSDVR